MTYTRGLASPACRPPRFDMRQDRICRNSPGGISEILLMSRYYFFPEPAFQSRLSVQQRAYTIAHDFADRRIGPRFDLALHELNHFGMAA